jgi:WD40-like Beta Propeller Repeat
VNGGGKWQHLSTTALNVTSDSDTLITPAGGFTPGFSANASYVGYIKYRGVYATGTGSNENSGLSAKVPIAQPEHLVISGDGTSAAVAGGGNLYVAGLRDYRAYDDILYQLSGAGRIEEIAFLGSGRQLVSAAGDVLSFWNLDQRSRLSPGLAADVRSGGTAGVPPDITVAPDGMIATSRVISNSDGVMHDLSGSTTQNTKFTDFADYYRLSQYYNGMPLWSADGSQLLWVGPGGTAHVLVGGQAVEKWPKVGASRITSGRISPDGQRVVLIDDFGGIQVRNFSDGRLLRSVRGKTESLKRSHNRYSAAISAISPDTSTVALANSDNTVTVIDTKTGNSHQLPGREANAVSFGDNQLVVQHKDGALEIWDAYGRTKINYIPGDAVYTEVIQKPLMRRVVQMSICGR